MAAVRTLGGLVRLHSSGRVLVTDTIEEPCDCECPSSCPTTVSCLGATLPIGWRTDLSAFSSHPHSGCNGFERDNCAKLSRTFTLVNNTKACVWWDLNSGDGFNPEWLTLGGECGWSAVFPSKNLNGYPTAPAMPVMISLACSALGADNGNWTGETTGDNTSEEPSPTAYFDGFNVSFKSIVTANIESRGTGPSLEIRIQLDLVIFEVLGLVATYYSEWYPISHDFLTGNIVVTFDSGTDEDGVAAWSCGYPETLTLVPDQESIVVRRAANCATECLPIFNDGPYGLIEFEGLLGGQDLRVCLSRDFTPDDMTSPDFVRSWSGNSTISLPCGDKALTLRLFCDTVTNPDMPQWKLSITNVTDSTTETYLIDIGVDEDNNIVAMFSELLGNFCGSDILAGDFTAYTGPIEFPCCELSPEQLCALGGIPAMVINETFPIDNGTATATGSLGWNGTDRWIGDITWTYSCDVGVPDPPPPQVWSNCEITCGYSLEIPGVGSFPSTGGESCFPEDISFDDIETGPATCGGEPVTVTLPFHMAV